MSPAIAEQLDICDAIARHGKTDAVKNTCVHPSYHEASRMVDHWQHMADELKFLRALIRKYNITVTNK